MSLHQSIPRITIPCRCRVRNFHGSRPRHDLVAPPHPVSHFRPIIYGDASSQPPPTYLRHPYSLSEFTTGTGTTLGDHELQFLLQRQQLDTFHHSFWLEVSVQGLLLFQAIKPLVRVTPGSMEPGNQSLAACRQQQPLATKRSLSLNSTNSGFYKKENGRKNIQKNGGDGTMI